MRRAAIAILFAVIGANEAQASCAVTCGCDSPSDWVVEGTVEPSDGGAQRTSLRVNRVFAAPDASSPAVGELLESGATVGEVFLVASAAPGARVTDGGVTCNTTRFTVDEYAAMLRDGSCEATKRSKGFVQPPCRDFGCGCSSVAGPFAALVITLAGALRRRASRR